MADILIIDDDRMLCRMLDYVVTGMNHRAACAATLAEGVDKLHSVPFEVVLLDVGLPDGNGLEALARIRQTDPHPEVIVITGHGDQDGAETAIKNGAWDYIQKPLIREEIKLALNRALQYHGSSQRPAETAVSLQLENLVGSSPQMKACYDSLAQAANCDANVLITGETGTGKELFAQAIHTNSIRCRSNFVVVDCAALPETLVESTLFGHEKGAYTGADKYREGLIKQADGGTLFLDEVGELPLPIQRAFLRVLQEKRFRPVGSTRELNSDFRLIAATNRSLDAMVQAGQFRHDLLFRLQSMTIELPPLRERDGDTKELVMHYMKRLCDRRGIGAKDFAANFFPTLAAYSWPGNVRELINALENVIATAGDDPVLFAQHLPKSIRSAIARASIRSRTGAGRILKPDAMLLPLEATLKEFRTETIQKAEKTYLKHLMSIAGDDIRQSCRLAGLSRPRLYALLKKHHISRFENGRPVSGPANCE